MPARRPSRPAILAARSHRRGFVQMVRLFEFQWEKRVPASTPATQIVWLYACTGIGFIRAMPGWSSLRPVPPVSPLKQKCLRQRWAMSAPWDQSVAAIVSLVKQLRQSPPLVRFAARSVSATLRAIIPHGRLAVWHGGPNCGHRRGRPRSARGAFYKIAHFPKELNIALDV
jgi:hypothetical protein